MAHKMKALADIDKDTIAQQSKKMQALKFENQQIKEKYLSLKRNFESISTYAKKDKEESEKILAMKTEYESKINELASEKKDAEKKLDDTQQKLWEEQTSNKALTKRAKDAEKELDTLKRDAAKREKQLQASVDAALAERQPLLNAQAQLNIQIEKLREKSKDQLNEIAELEKQLGMSKDSLKAIQVLN